MSAKQDSLRSGRCKGALGGAVDRAENRGFRMHKGHMTTYRPTQVKLGLSAYYDKRRVLPEGVYPESIEYALSGSE